MSSFLYTIAVYIGLIFVFIKCVHIIIFIYKNFIRKPINLIKRYGQKSWVFITGSSDGIGKAFAIAFAKRGFNIIISARNLEKLKKTEDELKSINKNIQTKIIVADFQKGDNVTFYDDIFKQIQHLDISVLVNNVGFVQLSKILILSQCQILNYSNTNLKTPALLTKKFIPKFSQRTKKSAIINLSSTLKDFHLHEASLYGATKKFNDFFSQSLAYQYPNIDIISFVPSLISTPATLHIEKDLFISSPEHAVESFMNEVGYEIFSNGIIAHKIQNLIFITLPQKFLITLTKRFQPKKMKDLEDFYNKQK